MTVSRTHIRSSAVWLIVISVTAFGLHFVWESVQCIPLFVHGVEFEGGFLETMAWASAGDVVLAWIAYLITAVAVRDTRWPARRWCWNDWLALELAAVGLSVGFELYALQTDRWAYTEINPTLPGIDVSIVPILQLVILFPLTFRVARYMLVNRRGSRG